MYAAPETMTGRTRATGTRRRVRALAWMGHHPETYAHTYHVDAATLIAAMTTGCEDAEPVDVDTWRAAAIAFEDLCMTFGPDEWLREHAAAEGWRPPLAFDDDTIDVSNSGGGNLRGPSLDGIYDEAAVYRRMHGDHTVTMYPADNAEAVRRCHASGMSDWEIADALGMWGRSVLRIRHRLGLPALTFEGEYRDRSTWGRAGEAHKTAA